MSLNQRTCCLLHPHLQPGKLKYAWISNDTLISALRPFFLTRPSRRHVALAPGPLEARKRASRRRLMGLAPSGAALPAGDIASQPGIESWLFGRSTVLPQTYQWQKPSDPVPELLKKKGTFAIPHSSVSKLTRYLEMAILPLWLTSADPPREQTAQTVSENAKLSNPKVPKDAGNDYLGQLQDPHPQGPNSLEQCKSLGEIRKFLIFESGRRPEGMHELHSQAIQCLLENGTPLENILELLEDPELKDGKAKNLGHLIHWIQKASLKTGEDKILVNWIQTQVILGFLPFQDVTSLLDIIDSPSNSALAALNREEFYAKLIEGVQRCTVCGSMSAKESMLNTIFLFVSSGEISPTMVSLGWDLVRTLSKAHRGLMTGQIGSFVCNCISSQILSESHTALVPNVEDSIAIALKNIRSFPDHQAAAFIQSASEALIIRIKDSNPTISGYEMEDISERKRSLEQLDQWWTSLHDCGLLPKLQELPSWQIVEHVLGSRKYEVLISYLRLMGHRSKCLFFIRHCFQSRLECRSWREADRSYIFRAHIEAQFKDIIEEHPCRSPFVSLLISIRLANFRRDDIIQNLFEFLRIVEMPGTTMALARAITMTRVRMDIMFVAQEINHYIERNEFRVAYRVFQLFSFVPLEYVPGLARVIIANPDLSTHTAFHYRNRRQKWIDQVPPTDTDLQSHTQLRTDLLNDMAYASAQSPHTLRISLRQVYKCYLTLKRERLPITAKLTKALTYAGVVRYLLSGKWVSTERYNVIWALVREVEGQQVADRLDDLVYFWRGKVLDQQMYRKRKERALGLPYGSYDIPHNSYVPFGSDGQYVPHGPDGSDGSFDIRYNSYKVDKQEKYRASELPTFANSPSMKWRHETQWYQEDGLSHLWTPGRMPD